MAQENNQFSTQDINLATFLCAKGITLTEIRAAVDVFHCTFFFEKPPQELIDYWISGAVYERSIINCYRHLIRGSKEAQAGKMGGRR